MASIGRMPSSHTKSDKHVECVTLALTWSQAAQFGGHTEVARECWLDSRLGGYGSVVAEQVRGGRTDVTWPKRCEVPMGSWGCQLPRLCVYRHTCS